MNEEFWRWYMYGHWVCLTQWLGFIMVEYACLGKGKVKHPLVWSCVITVLTMTLSVVCNFGFFTPMAVVLTIVFLVVTVLLFGGTPGQKFTACLINGMMCLLVENSARYVMSWVLKCELQQVIQRADCLVIMSFTNLVVSTGVAFFVGKWRRYNVLEPLQALAMSFFPGVVVVINIMLALTENDEIASKTMLVMTVGLTVAVMVHLCIVAMFNDQVMQRRSLHFQAELEQQRASALLDSYTAQRRLTHEFRLLQPKIVVCLGRVAAQRMIRPDFSVTREHGQIIEKGGILFMGTFHPAALLRQPQNKPEAFADFTVLRDTIAAVCEHTYHK